HTQEEIFLQVWGPPFQDEGSAAQVRKNISALRDLLEPERSAPRYIKVEEGAFARKGGYFFCPGVRFCLIEAV
ncbi:MAG: winged helix-turn-helix domain-containing protein, partial [Candidatus Eremiobacteraeota bacterium]|nr:winged helix-turn-helix domain-containing protein [Candidatus Eremiobacteraeota bacterium]